MLSVETSPACRPTREGRALWPSPGEDPTLSWLHLGSSLCVGSALGRGRARCAVASDQLGALPAECFEVVKIRWNGLQYPHQRKIIKLKSCSV